MRQSPPAMSGTEGRQCRDAAVSKLDRVPYRVK
jgi:hypothetical protein